MPQALLPIFPSDAIAINEIMSFCQRDGSVYYFHGRVPVYTHPAHDGKATRLWASQSVVNGSCTQADAVRAFGISPIGMKRYVKKLRERGATAFFAEHRTRRARKRRPVSGRPVLSATGPGPSDDAKRSLSGGAARQTPLMLPVVTGCSRFRGGIPNPRGPHPCVSGNH